jgi:oxygen-dependent protoporphyrinogen oxidase
LARTDSHLGDTLGRVRGFQTATVFFGLDATALTHDLEGSGFIVPPGESAILASTFISSKWEHRAPAGAALIRAFIGGARTDISHKDDFELQEIAHRELTRFLGPLGPLVFSRVHRYERGTPQPELGFTQLLAKIKTELEGVRGVSLIGSGYSGAGIPDCIRQANEFASTFHQQI